MTTNPGQIDQDVTQYSDGLKLMFNNWKARGILS